MMAMAPAFAAAVTECWCIANPAYGRERAASGAASRIGDHCHIYVGNVAAFVCRLE